MSIAVARVFAILGAVGAAVSVWLDWIDGVPAAHLPWKRLFGWEMLQRTDTFVTSIGMVIVVSAAVAMIGVLLPARAPAFVGAVVPLAVTALLLVQEHLFLPNGLRTELVDGGVWLLIASCSLLVIGSLGLKIDVQRELVAP